MEYYIPRTSSGGLYPLTNLCILPHPLPSNHHSTLWFKRMPIYFFTLEDMWLFFWYMLSKISSIRLKIDPFLAAAAFFVWGKLLCAILTFVSSFPWHLYLLLHLHLETYWNISFTNDPELYFSIYVVPCCAESLSHVQLFVTPWTIIHQTPLSMGTLHARILEWVAMPSSRGLSQPRDWTQVSYIAGRLFTIWATRATQEYWSG